MFHLYAKFPGDRTFKAMDYNAGRQVGNLIRATLLTAAQCEQVAKSFDLNPGVKFEFRAVKGWN